MLKGLAEQFKSQRKFTTTGFEENINKVTMSWFIYIFFKRVGEVKIITNRTGKQGLI